MEIIPLILNDIGLADAMPAARGASGPVF